MMCNEYYLRFIAKPISFEYSNPKKITEDPKCDRQTFPLHCLVGDERNSRHMKMAIMNMKNSHCLHLKT